MKKIAIAFLAFAAMAAQAANFVQVEQEHVNNRKSTGGSEVSYTRFGKDIGDYGLGVQSRTARFDGGGIASSLEVTGSNKNVSAFGITPFVGVGHDFGGSTAGSDYTYGLVGATAGKQIGPGFALVGAKARVGTTEAGKTKQTVTFASYAVPVAKDTAVNVGISRSAQDIKERGVSVGVSFGF
jgi:hypothetical protein